MVPSISMLLLLASLGSQAIPTDSGPEPQEPDQAQAFLVVTGEVVGLGIISGEGGLELVTAMIREGNRTVSVRLAPASVFLQTGFLLREGDQVEVKLFQVAAGELPPVQSIQNRTLDSSIRLRSIRGEPLWDGEGRWRGGFCTHGMDREHASRR